jgi:hypothetical protein
LLLDGRLQEAIFWLVAILVAFVEPVALVWPVLQTGTTFSMDLALLFGASFIANMLFAALFRLYGFLAPVIARLSFYVVWHIVFAGLF